ncbi:MAG TPA: hypothetical protein VED59_05290, partial [Acidimicrobiales bacterium]|nr:hypothetical protein [Acidimicrobiales bacterium]
MVELQLELSPGQMAGAAAEDPGQVLVDRPRWRSRRPRWLVWARGRRGPAFPRPLPARRTVKLSIAILALSAVACRLWVHWAAPQASVHVTWWELAAGFAAADIFVFHIEINRDAHTFSLSEMPFVLGLFFASPAQLIVGRLVGEAVVLVFYERQTLVKLTFNLSLFFAE